jgi:hypothetical protein
MPPLLIGSIVVDGRSMMAGALAFFRSKKLARAGTCHTTAFYDLIAAENNFKRVALDL